MLLLGVAFVILQVHAARLQVELGELHRRASIERLHIELGTNIRRGCRQLYVALLEHWHGHPNSTWERREADIAALSNTLSATPAWNAEEAEDRAQARKAVDEWLARLRSVIAGGEGPSALPEMRTRQALVDQWSDRVLAANVAAGKRFDLMHGSVHDQWVTVEVVAASMLISMVFLAIWWRVRARAATMYIEQAARETERAARSEFFTNMSHELRTPLVSIGGFASMIEDNPNTMADVRGYARKIHHVSRELLGIINNILDVAKLESEHMKFFIEPVSIEEVLERCIARAEGLVGHKELTFAIDIGPGVPRVRGDFVKLQQVFTNLIGNAVKFTEKGEIKTRVTATGKNVVVEVEDTGIGIDAQSLETIWEPFRQVDHKVSRKFGGSGLGLAIVHAVVTRLGGEVSVSSTVGGGTTFRVTLPADANPSTPGSPLPSSRKTRSRNPSTA